MLFTDIAEVGKAFIILGSFNVLELNGVLRVYLAVFFIKKIDVIKKVSSY